MKEDFLHHIWKFKKFSIKNLKTVKGNPLQIISAGQYLQQAGPDFFSARIVIDGQEWAGNVEIHIKSSDWYLHNHENDTRYDNVILHVVWEHDTEVMRRDNTEIPVLELKDYIDTNLLENYTNLTAAKTWINCEKQLSGLDEFLINNWKERLYFERLERKALPVLQLAAETKNDWEAVLFCFLARNFGLNINGDIFYEMAKSIPFHIIRKEAFTIENIESLLYGQAGLLNEEFEEQYPRLLQQCYKFICHKYSLKQSNVAPVDFYRHRPDNFPTIRLSQLAMLYHTHQNLFTKIINADSLNRLYDIFRVEASAYWKTHYRFDKESAAKSKRISASFTDLLIINTVIPFKFAYAKSTGNINHERLLELVKSLKAEKNAVIEKFEHYKMPVNSAYDTQSLLQLKKEYCDKKRCMQCAIGTTLLK